MDESRLHAVWSLGIRLTRPYIRWLFFCAGFARQRLLRRVVNAVRRRAGVVSVINDLHPTLDGHPVSIPSWCPSLAVPARSGLLEHSRSYPPWPTIFNTWQVTKFRTALPPRPVRPTVSTVSPPVPSSASKAGSSSNIRKDSASSPRLARKSSRWETHVRHAESIQPVAAKWEKG